MVESFRKLFDSHENYKLTKFAPVAELERILAAVPAKDADSYIGIEIRNLLKDYGVDFDYPLSLRSMGRPFKRSLQRRAAVIIGSDDLRARLLVIDTDSRSQDVVPDRPLPHDPDNADILIWPMQISRKELSQKAWFVGGDDGPTPFAADFVILIKKFGTKDFINVSQSVPAYGGYVWRQTHGITASDILKHWAGFE